MRKLLLFGVVPLAIAAWSTGCSGDECADCGPCGIAGPPAAATGLQTTNVGKTAQGAPAVNLLYWSGNTDDCEAEDVTGVVYDLDNDTATQTIDFVELASDRDRVGEDMTHTWAQEDLELSVEPIDDRALSLVFTHGDRSVFLDCQVEQNDIIDCN